jgi:hypothetical protein
VPWKRELVTSPVQIVLQLAVGLVLLISGLGKVRHSKEFALGVADYELLPFGLSYAIGIILIPLELGLALCHLTGVFLSIAVVVGFILFAVFAMAVSVNLKRGVRVPCYCFGNHNEQTISGRTLARLALLLAGEAVLLTRAGFQTTNHLLWKQVRALSDFTFSFVAAALLLVAAMWLLSWFDLREEMQPLAPQR